MPLLTKELLSTDETCMPLLIKELLSTYETNQKVFCENLFSDQNALLNSITGIWESARATQIVQPLGANAAARTRESSVLQGAMEKGEKEREKLLLIPLLSCYYCKPCEMRLVIRLNCLRDGSSSSDYSLIYFDKI